MSQNDPKPKRTSKKTEALEIRLSPEEKSAFLAACQRAGRTASAVLRDAMRAYAQFGPVARLPGSPVMIASAFLGATAGAFLLVQMIQPAEAEPEERLYGMRTFNAYAVSGLYDREMLWDEYRERTGTLRDILHQLSVRDSGDLPYHDRETLAGRSGEMFGGVFIPAGLDSTRFMAEPDRVSAGCWAVLEAHWLAQRRYQFSEWDGDDDGIVTAREFSQAQLTRHRLVFGMQDKDGDGFITRTDFEPDVIEAWADARRVAMEAAAPAPSSRRPRLDPQQVAGACAAEREWAQPAPPRSRDDFLREPEAGAPPPLNSAAGHVAAYDVDGNGRVSFAEFVAASGS